MDLLGNKNTKKNKPKRKTLKKKKKLIIMNSSNIKNKPVTPKMEKQESVKPSPPYNKSFISILEKLNEIMLAKGEFMRARAYQKAVQSLLSLEGPINSVDDIKDLKGIG